MSMDDYLRAGTPNASALIFRSLMKVLIDEKLVSRDQILEILDRTLLAAENGQASAAALSNESLVRQWRGARMYVELVRTEL